MTEEKLEMKQEEELNAEETGEKEKKHETPSKFKKSTKGAVEKAKVYDEKTDFSLYLGPGLYQFMVGLMLLLLVSFLIGLPIVMAHPYINPIMLISFKLIGYGLLILGIITCIIPIIRNKAPENDKAKVFSEYLTFYSAIITFLLMPIGLILSFGLYDQYKDIRREKSNSAAGKLKLISLASFAILLVLAIIFLILGDFGLPFILLPLSLFVALPLAIYFRTKGSKIAEADEPEKRTEKQDLSKEYFILMFFGGLIHVLFGALILFVLLDVLLDVLDLLYPYINYDLINFLTILGWLSLVPGLILVIASLGVKKITSVDNISTDNKGTYILWLIVVGASVFLVLVFPIGTFFGLTLLQEFMSLRKKA